jgi:hypothetical protein
MVRCTEACLDPKQCQYPRNLTLVDLRTPIGLLAPLELPFLALRRSIVFAKHGQY